MNSTDDNKTKRILCFNAIKGRVCNYGPKCMYAHNLSEQKIDPIRHKVYTILKNDNDLSNINLIKDRKLFTTFVQLTKICYHCSKNECHGGYNCRNGTVNQKYKICYDDLMYGNCRRLNCNGLHLSTRGLVPYYIQMNNNKQEPVAIKNKVVEINEEESEDYSEEDEDDAIESDENPYSEDDIDGSYDHDLDAESPMDKLPQIESKQVSKVKFIKSKRTLNRNLQGILVTENFLIDYYKNRKKRVNSNNSDTEDSNDTIYKMKKYLNEENSEDSLDESIFKI